MEETTIFRWETARVIGEHILRFRRPVHGMKWEIELTSGSVIDVFRVSDAQAYFCHGLSFGGKDAPGRAISPYSGEAVKTILADFYIRIEPEANALAGDVLVWYDLDESPVHSAILVVARTAGDRLDYASVLRSKNGNRPEADLTLESLVARNESYGESYAVYRRR